jgi:[histone H3]-lysine36 N-trimethyltransferase
MGRTKTSDSRTQSVDDGQAMDIKRESSVDASLAQEPNSAQFTRLQRSDSATASRSPSTHSAHPKSSRSASTSSSTKPKVDTDDVEVKPKLEKLNGHTSPVKNEAPKSKIGRSAASKGPPPRIAPLFHHLPDVTSEATSSFQVIDSSTYQNKYLGFTESALECDCSEEWG